MSWAPIAPTISALVRRRVGSPLRRQAEAGDEPIAATDAIVSAAEPADYQKSGGRFCATYWLTDPYQPWNPRYR